MTERLADITARIDGIRKLGSVVNAMRGIAAARAQQARDQLNAVDSYAQTIAGGIAALLPALAYEHSRSAGRNRAPALVVFLAEQGFAGAFSERVLRSLGAGVDPARLFLLGTRGSVLARDNGLTASWIGAMPPHSTGVPPLADRLARALYEGLGTGRIDALEVVFTTMAAGKRAQIVRKRLLPVEFEGFRSPVEPAPRLLNLPVETVLEALLADYVHAQLCNAALHSFAAESEARLAAMTSTRSHIADTLNDLQMTQRVARQEEITAEIIELAAGASASLHRT